MFLRTELGATPAGDAVTDVVEGGSKSEMGRVDARWVVATMENPFTGRDRSVMECPGRAMRGSLATVLEQAVSFAVSSAEPFPAVIQALDVHHRQKARVRQKCVIGLLHTPIVGAR